MSNPTDQMLSGLCLRFAGIKDGDHVLAFMEEFGFRTEGLVQNPKPQTILVAQLALHDGRGVKLSERWYDPSGPFQNLPDIHVVWLELDSRTIAEVRYEG